MKAKVINERGKRAVLMSVKAPYAELLVDGIKTFELRRRFPLDLPSGTKIYVYSSARVHAVIGECEIDSIVRLPIDELWDLVAIDSMVSWRDFESYFSGREFGYAIKIKQPSRYEKPINLGKVLKNRENPRPPQSYCYA